MLATRQPNCPPRVLLVTADVELRSYLAHTLSHSGYEVCPCDSLMGLLQSATDKGTSGRPGKFDLVVCEVELLKNAGFRPLEILRDRDLLPPLVLVCWGAGAEALALARRLSAAGILESNHSRTRQLSLVRAIVPVARPPNSRAPRC